MNETHLNGCCQQIYMILIKYIAWISKWAWDGLVLRQEMGVIKMGYEKAQHSTRTLQ